MSVSGESVIEAPTSGNGSGDKQKISQQILQQEQQKSKLLPGAVHDDAHLRLTFFNQEVTN